MGVEAWRSVVGYEGLYEVSDLGRVRSLDRVDMRGQSRASRILKAALLPNGRYQVSLYREGVSRCFRVHRLVARAFHGEPRADQVVCHNDGDPTNNAASNVRWGTASENQLDAVKHGTHREARKTHCLRGHPLVEPNLVPAHLERGQRNCRACGRAQAAVRRHPELDLQQVADERYARLMAA